MASHSLLEGDHTNQNLLTQMTNLNVIEEGHPSIKILPSIAVHLNQDGGS